MRRSCILGWVACLALPLVTGCAGGPSVASSESAGVIRAQSPGYQYGHVSLGSQGPGMEHGNAVIILPDQAYGDDGDCDEECDDDGHKLKRHKYRYTYYPPQGLCYPPPNMPTPIVQYPYYTVRGPTDFFMK